MFNNISWTAYIAFVTLSLIGYYLFIGIKFYSLELRQLLSGKSRLSIGSASSRVEVQENEESNFQLQEIQPELFTSHQKYTPLIQETDDTFQQVEELTAQLKEVITQAVEKNYIKEEFVLSLQLVLKQYHFLKGSLFLVAINNLIASECEKYGYIQLSAEERVMLWNE